MEGLGHCIDPYAPLKKKKKNLTLVTVLIVAVYIFSVMVILFHIKLEINVACFCICYHTKVATLQELSHVLLQPQKVPIAYTPMFFMTGNENGQRWCGLRCHVFRFFRRT